MKETTTGSKGKQPCRENQYSHETSITLLLSKGRSFIYE